MAGESDGIRSEGALKVQAQRQLAQLGLDEGGDSGVAKLEDLMHLLAPLVVLHKNEECTALNEITSR